jgi:hypothetical protein
MPSLILECPHCGADKIGFNVVHQYPASTKPAGIQIRYRTWLSCSACEEGIIGIFQYPDRIAFQPNDGAPMQCPIDPRMLGWHLNTTYPSPQPSKCPSYTPDDLKRIFLQADKAQRRGDPDASGAMSRKVVDVSTQQLLGEESKKYGNIRGRIDALALNGTLTIDLKDWAHQVRLGGNDAAHDIDPFTMPEADELLNFAELYLTYVYTLPGRLKERRDRAAVEKVANP